MSHLSGRARKQQALPFARGCNAGRVSEKGGRIGENRETKLQSGGSPHTESTKREAREEGRGMRKRRKRGKREKRKGSRMQCIDEGNKRK